MLQLKSQGGKHIYVDGGAEVIQALLKEELIDELIISIVPVLLGDGTALFRPERPELQLKLVKVLPFKSGLVQLHYTRADKNAMPPNH